MSDDALRAVVCAHVLVHEPDLHFPRFRCSYAVCTADGWDGGIVGEVQGLPRKGAYDSRPPDRVDDFGIAHYHGRAPTIRSRVKQHILRGLGAEQHGTSTLAGHCHARVLGGLPARQCVLILSESDAAQTMDGRLCWSLSADIRYDCALDPVYMDMSNFLGDPERREAYRSLYLENHQVLQGVVDDPLLHVDITFWETMSAWLAREVGSGS